MNRSVKAVFEILETGDFDSLQGTTEDYRIEFKSSPYQLTNDAARHELAKDVSALANADGGIILIGFRTSKNESTAEECMKDCRPFDLDSFDTDQYRKILDAWICPPIPSLAISTYPSRSDIGKGVVAICIPATAHEGKPYVVNRTVEADGKVRGTLFGYYERVEDRIPATSAETLRGHVRDGMRFSEVMRRLDTIEAFLGNAPTAESTGITDLELEKRITDAEKAVDRTSKPNVILSASSMSKCGFPELFSSGSTPIVRLIQSPPVLRVNGFAITPASGHRPAEIIQGRLRRVVATGSKLVELWRDGMLITVGPGDDDLLCWFTRAHRNAKPGLPIRTFVLAEITLNFCILAIEAFKDAEPKPKQLKFLLKLNNMTEEGVPCRLSSYRDNSPSQGFSGYTRDAPGPCISYSFVASLENLDVGVVAYNLLGGLFAEFGFNYDDMPYVGHDSGARRITPDSLFDKSNDQ
jgi:hypothetical protein